MSRKKLGINHIAAKASLQPRPSTLLSSLDCSTEIMSRNYDLVKIFRPKTRKMVERLLKYGFCNKSFGKDEPLTS